MMFALKLVALVYVSALAAALPIGVLLLTAHSLWWYVALPLAVLVALSVIAYAQDYGKTLARREARRIKPERG